MRNLSIKLITLLVTAVLGVFMATAQTKTITHTVGRGETLESIAKRYGTTREKIIELNPDATQFIYVGMELVIPVIMANEIQKNNSKGTEIAQGYRENEEKNYLEEYNNKTFNEVLHRNFWVAQYQLGDFRYAEYTSCYGVGIFFPSICNWGAFHFGGNLNFSINAGVVKYWGCLFDFGPSIRYDFTENVFFNMPIDVRCVVTFPEGTTSTHTDWGMQFAPALHVFLTEKFGIYVGPQMTIGFNSGAKPAFGLVAGISFDI